MKTTFNILLICFTLLTDSVFSQTDSDFIVKKEFTELSEALKKPENVIKLDLSNQNLDINTTDWSRFVNLEYLNLKNDHLKEIPIGITLLKSLKVLDLSGNDFKTLPYQFENLVNLEEVYLNSEKNMDLPKTLAILSKLPKLKSLHLEDDNIKILPSEILSFKNLENLYLNHNKLRKIPEISTLDHLKYLDLNGNKIKPESLDLRNLNFGFEIKF